MAHPITLSQWAKERVLLSASLGSEYKNLVKGLGAMIIQNGLLGTMIFLEKKAKDGKAHFHAALSDIQEYLKKEGMNHPEQMAFEESTYLSLTAKVLDMIKWLRRYADILIEGE